MYVGLQGQAPNHACILVLGSFAGLPHGVAHVPQGLCTFRGALVVEVPILDQSLAPSCHEYALFGVEWTGSPRHPEDGPSVLPECPHWVHVLILPQSCHLLPSPKLDQTVL